MNGTHLAIRLLAVFFLVATGILLTTGTALLFPGTAADAIWSLRPSVYSQFQPFRALAGAGFLTLAIPMFLASLGFFRRRIWGWWLAIAIFAINGTGDAVQVAMGRVVEGAVGVCVAGTLIFFLTRPTTRAMFS